MPATVGLDRRDQHKDCINKAKNTEHDRYQKSSDYADEAYHGAYREIKEHGQLEVHSPPSLLGNEWKFFRFQLPYNQRRHRTADGRQQR
jgi:hypothetical protein